LVNVVNRMYCALARSVKVGVTGAKLPANVDMHSRELQ
jgi:hypothetical protein